MGTGGGLSDSPYKDPKDPWDSVHFSWAVGPEASMLIRHP